jgi:OOP family OmpA-OmpF porin
MDKGTAMTGFERHLKASLGLVLLTGLIAGCAHNQAMGLTPEAIPAQVCGGDADSDSDGITDCNDRCPNTGPNRTVDSDGCPLPEPEVLQPKPYRG